MNRALLLIDLQNDFLPGGALAVPDGDAVIEVANQKIQHAQHVVATQDWHPPGHGSFASSHDGIEIGDVFQLSGRDQVAWPDHCVQGTFGAEFSNELHVDEIDHVVCKGTDPTVDSYSGFFDNDGQNPTGLDAYLKAMGITKLEIMGLATDYCVMFTVLDALQLGYEVEVDLAGCRGVNLNEGDVDRAIATMRTAGALVT
ncbi:MAG: bifunctional nicotinamidase/pyrazinamidase [Planctomycetales bacterium]|nr:bifunctional nicotinamidase/pyrazinamidase [Planctomycetales bacterium]